MKRTPLRKKSSKQAKIDREVHAVFLKVLEYYDWRCTGCGNNRNLTPSHIIRRSRRPDLITEFHNIKPHCIRCHEKWDSGDPLLMFELEDFEENMRYIKEVDTERFQFLSNKITELINATNKNSVL